MRPEARIIQLGLQFPPVSKPKGLYRPLVVVDNLAYTAGHLPVRLDGTLIVGRVGADMDQETAGLAARQAGLAILATVRAELGNLDRVRRVVRIFGSVQCTSEFHMQPAVINELSELFAEVFGPEAGIGVRTAIGVNSLPLGVPVEAEAIFEIDT